MATQETPLAHYLAKNIIELRKVRRITQAQLAQLSGVPRSTITHIESGMGNPSIKNLLSVCAALQVSIQEILAEPRPNIVLIPKEEIPQINRGAGQLYKLLPDPVPGTEIDRIVLQPGGAIRGVPHLPNTREYLTCLMGKIKVIIGAKPYDLKEGDVLCFPGNLAHAYRNDGDVETQCISVVLLTHPQFGTQK